ncbi:chromosome partitioning protein ParB [Candidatus Saccharibacteria bacterium RIFCSPHIGHO2_01_FULL_45_15]|nr:MAG: chromosome partitioning protein ParB [Candidatus Saccharibacteria bacterium RIFCSPHIGHO2_01_FULL_45_15]OGL26823.1 MAG: chromosome partitioning protein ParB [Candidatus Saccharibacteria bacterium RIFCSPHIGHO2_02_FULL_46_12]OGL32045.1 MAG: chromosome partitioning protein ParB [Candidatus Saccharibacteria bacterium RIFCSPHIGHO2_12_FULL_44_22]
MSVNKKGLGRGFASLIPTELLDESFDPTAAQDERMSELRHIKLTEIVADPDQPRRSFDEAALDEMAASIVEHGILQPIVVTPHKGHYQIVAGERRYRASVKAGLDKIPALVRTLSNQHKLELSLIENLQRRDLNVLETATAYLKLRDQFNLSLEQIGARVGGKSISAVSNTLRLLRLPENVRQALAEGKIREGQARPLVGLDTEVIDMVLPQILKEEWSSRRIEQFIVDLKKDGSQPAKQTQKVLHEATHDKEIKRLEKRLSTKIKIRTNAKGAGQIVIAFKSSEEFERIQKVLES